MSEKSSLTDFEQGIIQGRIQGRKQMEEQLIDSCSYCDRKIPFGEIYFAMARSPKKKSFQENG